MNHELISTDGSPIRAWIKGVPVEPAALEQAKRTASLPFVRHMALMPDCHFGIGATVGSVVATAGAVIPAAVGVDIGCGMMAYKLSMKAADLPDNMAPVRSAIEDLIPVGNSSHEDIVPLLVGTAWVNTGLMAGYQDLIRRHPEIEPKRYPMSQLGTLGGGNHFIEICLDTEDNVWIMLHSGSRGIGNRIGSYFINQAKEEMTRLGVKLADKDLAYLTENTGSFIDYVKAVSWAQDYAMENRRQMMWLVMHGFMSAITVPEKYAVTMLAVNCHHNYVEKETHFGESMFVTRKGAVRAGAGDLGIIPGSMGAKSYIVRGKGATESLNSCSHGAGRVMSRGEAKRRISLEAHIAATEGIECRKDEGVLDESPAAYKPIDEVMAAQTDLVEIVATLRQIVCIKG